MIRCRLKVFESFLIMALNLRGFTRPLAQFVEHVLSPSSQYRCVRLLSLTTPAINKSSSGTAEAGTQTTIASVIESWEIKFQKEDIPEPKNSIQNIVLHVMGGRYFSELEKHAHVEITKDEMQEIDRLCECRLARMPVQYIIGEWEFRGIQLQMAPPVFIPRPETEQLVDLAVSCLPHIIECDNCSLKEGCKINVLEIGSGSGAISLALVKEHPKIHCTAVDQSTTACRLTQQNAINLGVADHVTVLHAKLGNDASFNRDLGSKFFDLVISNPPYVPSKDVLALDPEIKLYEDLRALDGGEDGLRVVKAIMKVASKVLRHKGHLVMEVDPSHPEMIKNWLLESEQANLCLRCEKIHEDIFKKPRFVQIIKTKFS